MSIGRGLGALITSTTTRKTKVFSTGDSTASNSERIWSVPVSEIKSDPKQPRRQFNAAELQELSQSIRQHGILQPLLVTEMSDGGYQLVAGERRWRAAQLVGIGTVPVIVKEYTAGQKLEVALIENIQRQNLNPLEEAFAYQRLIEEFGLTQEQVAEKVGKGRPTIANTIRLLGLPEEVKGALANGKISVGQAKALLSIADTKQQLEVLASMQGEKITVRELERTAAKTKAPGSLRRDPNLLYLEDQLRSALGTKVAISQKGDRGIVAISYFSKEELGRVIKKIVG